MKTIYIIPIEPHDVRYTAQWHGNIPVLIDAYAKRQGRKVRVISIDGEYREHQPTAGAFLNFAQTNAYKASQVAEISNLFSKGKVKAGDCFLVTDAWNFAITSIRYMSELLGIKTGIHAIWHAGAYDPSDILGERMGREWSAHTEQGWFHAANVNYFATEYHRKLFLKNLGIPKFFHDKALVSGQPHEPLLAKLERHGTVVKQDEIVWPHRLNSDKQPEIAMDLRHRLNCDLFVTQEQKLGKEEYYERLSKARMCLSASLHENLGIGVMEATMAGAIPLVPDRLSYTEMYLPEFKYPSAWTRDWKHYQRHRADLMERIERMMADADSFEPVLKQQQDVLARKYMCAEVMYEYLV